MSPYFIMSKIVEYLENIQRLGLSDKQQIWYHFLLAQGKVFKVRKDFEKEDLPFIKQRQCFNNSFLTATAYEYEYFEGFYLCENIDLPIEHAFNKKPNDEVIVDLTAQKYNIPVEEWFGVKVPNWVLADWFNGNQFLTPLQYYFRFALETVIKDFK